MPDEFIVDSRADIMRENLLTVQRVLSRNGATQTPAVDRIVQMQTDLGGELSQVKTAIDMVGSMINDLQFRTTDDGLDARLEQLRTQSESSATDVKRIIDRLRDQRAALTLLRQSGLNILTDNRNDIRVQIHTRAEEWSQRLAQDSGTYFDVREQAERVFEEYAELLLGAAMRSPRFGLDDSLSDLFDIADVLPRLWPQPHYWQWNALTVPAGRERRGVSPANVLRMGFPEWSVWALPLLHVQFSRIYLSQPGSADFAELLEHPGAADALAAAFAGPASVLAALLFRLDPAAVTTTPVKASEASLDASIRSASALRTLQVIAEEDEQSPLNDLCTRVVAGWRAAVERAGGQYEAFERHFDDPDTAACARRAWAIAVERPSNGVGLPLPHWAANWATVTGWAAALSADSDPDLDELPPGPPLEPIVPLMNAMWFARIGISPAKDAPPAKLPAIAARARMTLLDIVRGASSTPGRSQRSWGGR